MPISYDRQTWIENRKIAHLKDEQISFLTTTNAPVFGVDTELLITEWNQQAEEISQFRKDETSQASSENGVVKAT